jgi:hypothetical protein
MEFELAQLNSVVANRLLYHAGYILLLQMKGAFTSDIQQSVHHDECPAADLEVRRTI